MSNDRIEVYLNFCQSKWWWEEQGQAIPPTAEEARLIVQHFRLLNLRPALVGTVGVYYHDTRAIPRTFRPGAHLEVFLHGQPGSPPAPWKLGKLIAGAATWLSETEGWLTLLVAGAPSPDGGHYPLSVAISPESEIADYPVAEIPALIKIMLSSMDSDHMAGIVDLTETLGHFPTADELGSLTPKQSQYLEFIRRWFEMKERRKNSKRK